MTTRSTPSSVQASSVGYRTDLNTGVVQTIHGPYAYSLKWTNTVTFGDNIPGWREKLRRGESATTSLVGSETLAQFTSGHAEQRWKAPFAQRFDESIGTHGIDISVPTGDPSTLDDSKADAEALRKFNQRLRERRTAFEGGVFLGELAQTIAMIRNPARGLRTLTDDFLNAARRLRSPVGRSVTNFKRLSLKSVTENLADLWLEAQFGWRPLLHDIDGGCQALALINSGQSVHTGRITAKGESFGTVSESHTSPGGHSIDLYCDEKTVGHTIVVYRGAIRVEARNPHVMDPALIGFDLSSFLPTVWELIPYSFLIDYFVNIGDIVTGWSNLGTRLSWCNRTVKRSYEKTCGSRYVPSLKPAHIESVTLSSPAKFVCVKTSVSRAKFTGTTVPALTFRLPSWGSLRWLNIAALVASRNSDRKWVYGD